MNDIFGDNGVYLEVLFFGVHDALLLVVSAVAWDMCSVAVRVDCWRELSKLNVVPRKPLDPAKHAKRSSHNHHPLEPPPPMIPHLPPLWTPSYLQTNSPPDHPIQQKCHETSKSKKSKILTPKKWTSPSSTPAPQQLRTQL